MLILSLYIRSLDSIISLISFLIYIYNIDIRNIYIYILIFNFLSYIQDINIDIYLFKDDMI